MHNDPRIFRALFETAPDAMVVVDAQGCIVLANPHADRLFGYGAGALVGHPVEILLPPEAQEAHRVHRSKYMAAPRERPMGAGQELTGRRSDDTRFPVEIALSPIHGEKGMLFVASIRDISDTQRARQALDRARYDTQLARAGQLALESPIDLTLERLPELLATALAVDAVLIVFGTGVRSQLQIRAAHGVPGNELDAVLEALVHSESGETVATDATPVSIVVKDEGDDAPTYASGVAARLFDVDRSMGSVVALSRAGRVFDREAIHFVQSVANLLAAALQRTRTLEQLAHAQRLEAVGQLTGGIAHDFNNLLTVISGNLQLLEMELAEREDTRAVIGSALRAVSRGAELTRKLLAFARRQRLSPRAISPQELLVELGQMLTRTLGEQVDLKLESAADVPMVFADPAQLDAALINLALNARDAMPRGGSLKIAVRQQRIDIADGREEGKPGEYVVFEVSDTGLGMSPDVLARAFEPFFTTKASGKGSGLGLSMVYGFVKQSGGHMRTDSRLGYGTSVALFLPRAAPHDIREGPSPGPAASTGNETVLVVEDEPDVRGIATAFLLSLGYAVHAAAEASEAMGVLVRNPEIALLFSDVVLGAGATGAEFALEARRLRPDLAVLLTSGYERPAAESREQPGAEFELLRKPYRREELAVAVRRVLDAR